MNVHQGRMCCYDNVSRSRHIIRGSVRQEKELVRLQRKLVSDNAVFGNADAVQAGADRGQPAHDHRSLQGCYDPGD